MTATPVPQPSVSAQRILTASALAATAPADDRLFVERNTIVNGLHVAAERFTEDVKKLQLTEKLDGPEIARLTAQFVTQHSDSITLAELIEIADDITLEVE